MASSFLRLDSSIRELRQQLRNEEHRFSSEFHEDEDNQGLFLAPVRQLFKPNSRLLGDRSLHSSLSSEITRIDTDSRFLKTFVLSTRRWSDAARVVKNLGSLAVKIDALIGGIAEELYTAAKRKYMSRRPLNVLDLVRNSQEKIDLLKSEFGESLEFLSGRSFKVHSFSYCYYDWVKFVESTRKNLIDIKKKFNDVTISFSDQFDAFETDLSLLQDFLNCVNHHFGVALPGDKMIDDFANHGASVVINAANQSCYCWFAEMDPTVAKSKITAILGLQRQIDLTNPEFLQFSLKFVKALNKPSPDPAKDQVSYVSSFLRYILKEDWTKNDLYCELEPLVTFLIDKQEESSQDVQSFLGEIKTMLLGVALLHQPLPKTHKPDPQLCFELLTKVCLLKIELLLKEQLNYNTLSMLVEKHRIDKLNKAVNKFKSFCKKLPLGKIENGKETMEIIEKVPKDIEYLYQSFGSEKTTNHKVRKSLLVLPIVIVLSKAESFLRESLSGNKTLMALGKDQVQILREGLEPFPAIVSNQQLEITEDMESIFAHIEAVSRGITSLSYLSMANRVTEEMIKRMMPSFPDLLHQMKLIKTKLTGICPKFPVSYFPKTNGLGFMDSLLGNLGKLLKYDDKSIRPVKLHIKDIQSHVEFLKCFLMNILESDATDVEVKELGNHVVNVAYKLAYIIDLIEIDAHWQHFLWFYNLREEIRLIMMQVAAIHEKTPVTRVHNVPHISSHIIRASSPEISEIVVSLSDEEEIIIDHLTRGSRRRDIVSIVGMAGIGKTTLAKKMYNDPKITYHFHCRAWCFVSHVYGKRELLLGILSDIHGLSDEINQMTDADLELKLCQLLRKNRFLIVMDDMWDIGALNDIERSFPDDENGSRILITTRLHNVALEAKLVSDPHSLRPLSEEESWNLLEMKIFRKGGGCPQELVEVGKAIAQHCKGLPLAVVAIAGILEKAKKKQSWWNKIAESLRSRIINDPETQCKDILQLSYMHLPVHLRSCFLYFGAFLDDKEVPVSKLIRLWIAEGFVQKNELKSLEDAAEDYLMDLIGGSLVMISKQRSNGRVKTCRIHDLLRDLCLSKAKEENFSHPITMYDEPYASFCDLDGADFYNYYPSNPVPYENHRLCICLKRKHFVDSRPSGPFTRSLIFLASSDTYPRRPYNVSFISLNFKLLWVLDLECINMGISFPTGIELLVHLRYLAVSGDMDSIPRSIANLRRLETLIVKGLCDKVVLPDSIWCMTTLRHLHVNNYADFNLQDDESGNSFQLDNLVSLSSPCLSHGKDMEKIIRQLPNLCKLRCIFLESRDSSMNNNQFPRLDCLTQLVSLRIIYFGRAFNPAEFNLPVNIKKLTLSNFRLPWNQIHAIGRLPKLEVLKLRSKAFEGSRWDMWEDEFCELKFLMLDTLNIAQWNGSCDHLPKLQQLVIKNCKNLEEVPYDFAEISTMLMIQVQRCRKSVEVSVRKIEEEAEGIKVIIC